MRKVKEYARRVQSYLRVYGYDGELALGEFFSMRDFLDWCDAENDVSVSEKVMRWAYNNVVDGCVDLVSFAVDYGNSLRELFEGSGMSEDAIQDQVNNLKLDVYAYFSEYAIYVVGKEVKLDRLLCEAE